MDSTREMIILWKETKSIPELLSRNFTVADAAASRAYLAGLEGYERREFSRLLKDLAVSLSQFIRDMKHDRKAIAAEFAKGQLRGKACVAYHNQSRINKKPR